MKYPIWFLRLLFASWMIPAGLNHFVPLYPQWMGFAPLSQEMIVALIDSGLFDLVKAVELIAGLGVLFGFYTPLMLLICLPVSFGVFYWDAPLEGWGSISSIFGISTFLCNLLLCLAYVKNYRAMFALRALPSVNKQLILIGRIIFGGGIALYAANYLFLSLWPAPTGSEPLALQLMTSLINSRLIEVAMWMQLIAGVMILVGISVPAALCLQLNISVCALYWSVILDQQLLNTIVTVVVFALNALLMLSYLPYYRGTLQRRALSIGEESGSKNYDALFVSVNGSISRAQFLPALILVLVAMAFYDNFVVGNMGQFCIVTLFYPAFVLLARRLRDMGVSAWLTLLPLALMVATFGNQFDYFSVGKKFSDILQWVAFAVSAAFVLWGCVIKGSK